MEFINFNNFEHYKYTVVGLIRFLNVLEWCLCSPMLELFDQKYSKDSNIAKY